MSPPEAVVTPFYLAASPGHRFCLYHAPQGPCRGHVLHVPPFAEEMNKSRRMVVLQARALARAGYAVLQVDLHGTGDSSGEFSEGRWSRWLDDLALGLQWLRQRQEAPVTLWGFRLGALLALDFARLSGERFEQHLLWQPLLDGQAYMNQFLRLRLANDLLTAGKPQTSVQALRDTLFAGTAALEVAGYSLAPELVQAVDALRLADLCPAGTPVHWLEVSMTPRPPSPALQRLLDVWATQGTTPDIRTVQGEPFWQTQEISECPALLSMTLDGMTRGH